MPSLFGFHAIEETLKAVKQSPNNVLHVAPHPGPRVKKLISIAQSKGISVVESDSKTLLSLSEAGDHRGAVLVTDTDISVAQLDLGSYLERINAEKDQADVTGIPKKIPLILALDSITDPHNLGAIIRSADKFGVDLVLVPARRSAQENETVQKSSAGASAWIQTIVVPNLNRAVIECKEAGFWVAAADIGGSPVQICKLRVPLVLIMGSEGKGIGKLLAETSDMVVTIPSGGHVDSFNVSVATGILLYEIRRQQDFTF